MKFIWDEKKNQRNIKKHRIDFVHASIAFSDPLRKEYFDNKHSVFGEDRFILLAYAVNSILFIIYTEPEIDTFRIISARIAENYEVEDLYNGNG
jgi:uncharacterized DUF497 family protein